ncbi:MAG: 16S rRNA (cytidine(1402)-2'-O)-methyltransferase [Clostridia bacterium]|nr:16S rRNA (cytidine(1402)-2'-O)-methyltransferase [Clostridia bacterium]MEE0789906.1 16S rRNA (cytidine(1402)-2'-O)-methyltransferase [Clostridia bacterium]
MTMNGRLYLVATPIGNLEDITLRALKVLEKVDVIAAEDTRHTLKLLNFYAITKPLISYHRHNEEVKSDVLIDKLKNGENIALVTDAGTPGISDPGEEIVKKAIENNIEIIPIPGACALINALICSGFNTKEFIFYGFLPINKKLRTKKLNEISKQNKTIILYEAPHKLLKTLNDILENIGDINCILAKEITKIHEEYIRGKISELISRKEEIKGEYVILLDLNDNEQEDCSKKEMPLEEQYEYYEKKGLEKKEIIKQIAKDRNTNKNEIYQKFLKK